MKLKLTRLIEACLAESVSRWLPNEGSDSIFDLQRPSSPMMGDFSLNIAMKIAKKAKTQPLEIAQQLASQLSPQTEVFREVKVAPPGFINLFLNEAAISSDLFKLANDSNLGIREEYRQPRKVVVDYSSVNIAKQMHVGHLRSTIIGDVIARVLETCGDSVIRQNHLGDWGLPMAMVLWKAIPCMRNLESQNRELEKELTLDVLEKMYREAAKACEEDSRSAEICHRILVSLQNGNPPLLADWKKVTRISMTEVYRIYQTLGVTLNPDHERGESFYRNHLAETVEALEKAGRLTLSQGAKCVFLDKFKAKDGSPLPLIVQKSDGGYNYGTFDLAGIRFRIFELEADRLIYVTDSRQSLHFSQVFEAAKSCGWANRKGNEISLEHVPFGSVLDENNKPLKTRSGENIKLSDLLSEAIDRALVVVNEKNPSLSEESKKTVARAVGIGAVKYADLSQNRNNDYVFSWNRMLSLNGNTAPYLQYAHARICSIFKKGNVSEEQFPKNEINLAHPSERALGLKLLQFPETVLCVADELRPHVLCNYLYELATVFSFFYDQCPVLSASSAVERASRLEMCFLVRSVLAKGLSVLGLESPKEM